LWEEEERKKEEEKVQLYNSLFVGRHTRVEREWFLIEIPSTRCQISNPTTNVCENTSKGQMWGERPQVSLA
jgi:hypothetical protein